MSARDEVAGISAAADTEHGEPRLFLLPLLCVRLAVPLPDEVRGDRDAAAAFSLRFASEQGMRACLVWSPRWSFWVWRDSPSAHADATAPRLAGGWVETTGRVFAEPHALLAGRHVTLTFE